MPDDIIVIGYYSPPYGGSSSGGGSDSYDTNPVTGRRTDMQNGINLDGRIVNNVYGDGQ